MSPDITALRREIIGSFLSVTAGWVASFPLLLYPPVIAIAGGFILVAYVTFFLPIYLLVPTRSPFWRWPVCTSCGVVSGAAIMLGFYRIVAQSPEIVRWDYFVTVAAVVGGVTCLFASLTRYRFHD